MDDRRMTQHVHKAVEQRCEALAPDPFLAARVMRMAEEKGERHVKKKLSAGLVICIVLMLLSLTAIAAVLLSGREIVEQQAVPAAQENDGEVRRNEMYSHEELLEVLRIAGENGVSLEGDSHIMEALAKGEGYYEEEVIMAICREAFGGQYYEWTIEEQYWYEDMMVSIGFANRNDVPLPGEGQMPSAEARALALSLLREQYGAELPLDDPALYRTEESFDSDGWSFIYRPRRIGDKDYSISFDHEGGSVSHREEQHVIAPYTERELKDNIDRVYGYRTYSQYHWGLEGWYAFGQWLPGAERSGAWSAEYDGYLATTYLLPGEGDLTAGEAKSIALEDAGAQFPIQREMLLLGKEDQRIWKVTLTLLNAESERESRTWEIDASTGEILHRMTLDGSTMPWARYMLAETYEAVSRDVMTEDRAVQIAIDKLRTQFGSPQLPLDDPACYDVTVRTVGGGDRYDIIFSPKAIEYGKCYVSVDTDGEAEIKYAHIAPANPDNLHKRMSEVYGSTLRWEQSQWVEFDRMQETLGEPLTFEGKLFAATHYPDASTVKITLDEALDAVQLDLGTRAEDAISWVLIDAEPNPVWKIRMGTFPGNTLYEVDAMTGEVVDRELYVCQRDDFDHDMKMFTLRRTYMPAALREFGPARIAMELTAKSDFDTFSSDETALMNEDYYTVHVAEPAADGSITVTFTSVDGLQPSWRTTILDQGLNAVIEKID